MHPTRQRLLDHGLEIARAKGLRGLTVRELASATGVNLGSFVYHFGSRDAYLQELVELWYAPLYAELQVVAQADVGRDALQRLRQTLEQLLAWVGSNAALIAHLIADAIAGEASARAFAQKLPSRHPQLILSLIAQAQAQGSLVAAPPLHLMLFLVTATGLPLTLSGLIPPDTGWMPAMQALRRALADPAAMRARLAWALHGISTPSLLPKPATPSTSLKGLL